MDEIGIPFAPVTRSEELFDDPHLNASDRLLDIDLGDSRWTRLPKLPIELSGHDLGLRCQPPRVGEHTREILSEIGLDEETINDLAARSIVACEA